MSISVILFQVSVSRHGNILLVPLVQCLTDVSRHVYAYVCIDATCALFEPNVSRHMYAYRVYE